jgi:hypothetical protein
MNSGQLSVIAVSPNVSNSRVVSSYFNVPSAIRPANQLFDVNRGLWITADQGNTFLDPISKLWYWYGCDHDAQALTLPNTYLNGYKGINIYSSPDLVNWKFVTEVDVPGSDGVNQFMERWHIIYNALNNNYVVWRKQAQTNDQLEVLTSPTPFGPFTSVATYSTIV